MERMQSQRANTAMQPFLGAFSSQQALAQPPHTGETCSDARAHLLHPDQERTGILIPSPVTPLIASFHHSPLPYN